MVRISKQAERRGVSFRKNRPPAEKTGPKKNNLPNGFKEHLNAVEGELSAKIFIPKIK